MQTDLFELFTSSIISGTAIDFDIIYYYLE
jgi:hypothetical protein